MPLRDLRYRLNFADSPGLVRQVPLNQSSLNSLASGQNFFTRFGKVGRANGNAKYVGTTILNTVAGTGYTGPVLGLSMFRPRIGSTVFVVTTKKRAWAYQRTLSDFRRAISTNAAASAYKAGVETPYDFEMFNNRLFFTNGVDQVQSWGGTGVAHRLTQTAPFNSAKVLKAFGGYLLAGRPTVEGVEWPNLIYWSAINNERSWSALQVMSLTKTPDRIIGMERLGDAIAVYMTNSIYLIYKTGDSVAPFQVRDTVAGIGAINRDAIVELGAVNVFVGQHNVYLYDGAGKPQAIADAIQDDFFGTLDRSRPHLIFAAHYPKQDEIWISRPTGNDYFNDVYVLGGVSSITSGSSRPLSWSKKSVPNSNCLAALHHHFETTWDEMTTTWNAETRNWDNSQFVTERQDVITGGASGYVYDVDDADQNNDGASYTGEIRTRWLDFDDDSIIKRLMRVYLVMTVNDAGSLTVYINTRDNLNETATTNGPYTLALDGSSPYIDVDLTARMFQLQAQTAGVDAPFEISEILFYFVPRSERSR